MRILGWLTVGIFYFFMIWRSFLISTGTMLSSSLLSSSLLSSMSLLLVFSLLIAFASVSTWGNPVLENSPPKIKRLALAGLIGLVLQMALGSEVRQSAAGMACPGFPNCLETFFPIPFTYETAMAFTHRWWGFLLLGVFFQLAFAAAKTSPALAGPARRAFALSVAQVFLGIGTVLSGLNAHSRVLHAAVGYALWGTVFFIVIRAGGVRWFWKPFSAVFKTS